MNQLSMVKKHRNVKLLKKIAFEIKRLRAEKNLTQEDFYNDTGINVGRIERGVNDLSVTTLVRICEYFEISPDTFFKKIK